MPEREPVSGIGVGVFSLWAAASFLLVLARAARASRAARAARAARGGQGG